MPKKTIKRRAWTDKDVRELKRLAKAKMPAGQIARKFKQTEGALRQKALHLANEATALEAIGRSTRRFTLRRTLRFRLRRADSVV